MQHTTTQVCNPVNSKVQTNTAKALKRNQHMHSLEYRESKGVACVYRAIYSHVAACSSALSPHAG